MSNYNINNNLGITHKAKRIIGAMTLGELLVEKEKLEIDHSHNVYDKMTNALLRYINSLLQKKYNNAKKYQVNYGGRRTRRNRSKRSTRRR
jgi:type II restriction/modification system DNA methylase subunit YeeA